MQSRQHVSTLVFRCWPLQRRILTPRCTFFTTPTRTSTAETAVVPCGNNGSITLDIYRPSRQETSSVNASDSLRPSILLYLPRGPVFDPKLIQAGLAADGDVASSLADASGIIVVQVNYRLDTRHRFPTPIHDVLAGYDWVVKHFAQHLQEGKQETGDAQLPVGVCGELLGGTLALSLALTECKLPAPDPTPRATMQRTADLYSDDAESGRIVAVSANNPIVDWVLPLERATITVAASKSKTARLKRKKIPFHEQPLIKIDPTMDSEELATDKTSDVLSPEVLESAQRALFHPGRLADRFDPFASPILFLRSPGVAVEQDSANAGQSPSVTNDRVEEVDALEEAPNVHDETRSDITAEQADSSISFQQQGRQADLDKTRVVNETADDTIVIPWLDNNRLNKSPSRTVSPTEKSTTKRPYKPRKLPRKYPPASMLPVSFPAVRLSAGMQSPLKEQTVEMVSLLRRALSRFEFPDYYASGPTKNSWGDGTLRDEGLENSTPPSSVEDMERFINQQIEFHLRGNGVGLWCRMDADQRAAQSCKQQEHICQVGEWFRNALWL